MIFDSLNEVLDKKRIFGIKGEIFPNKLLYKQKNNYLLKNDANLQKNNLLKIINNCSDEILDWNTYLCGFIQDKDDSFYDVMINLGENIVDQIKEDRMFKLVSKEILEFDQKMFFCEEEEYGIIRAVTEMIFEDLVENLVKEFL